MKFEEDDCTTTGRSQDNKNQRIFDRAYRLILQKGVAPQTEDFNGQYGFYRGICMALIIITWIALASTAINAYTLYQTWKDLGTRYLFWEDLLTATKPLLIALPADALYFQFRKKYERFAFYFANSVYMNFLVWWLTEEKKYIEEKK